MKQLKALFARLWRAFCGGEETPEEHESLGAW